MRTCGKFHGELVKRRSKGSASAAIGTNALATRGARTGVRVSALMRPRPTPIILRHQMAMKSLIGGAELCATLANTQPVPVAVEGASHLLDRRCILNATLCPQSIDPTRDSELGSDADVPLKHLSVIAYMIHDACGPIFRQADLLAIVAFRAH
jgi:hypothetical protein